MDIRSTDTSLLAWTGDTLALGLPEGAIEIAGELAELNDKLGGTLEELISETEFEGKLGSLQRCASCREPATKVPELDGLTRRAFCEIRTQYLSERTMRSCCNDIDGLP